MLDSPNMRMDADLEKRQPRPERSPRPTFPQRIPAPEQHGRLKREEPRGEKRNERLSIPWSHRGSPGFTGDYRGLPGVILLQYRLWAGPLSDAPRPQSSGRTANPEPLRSARSLLDFMRGAECSHLSGARATPKSNLI